MDVLETHAEGLTRGFRVVIPASEVGERVDRRLQEIGRNLRLPGFRPGKVPMSVLRERYGRSVTAEVVERLVAESSTQVLSERSLRPAAAPEIGVTPRGDGADLEFTLAIELMPDIGPLEAAELELDRLTVEATGQGAGVTPEDIARLSRARLKRELLDRLAARYDFPLPQRLVEHEFAGIWRTVEAQLARESSTGKSEAELRGEFRGIAERRVRLGLLLAELGRRHQIEVTDEEARAHVAEARRPGGQGPGEVEPGRSTPDAIARLRGALLEDKVVDFIIGRATVRERVVTLDELIRLAEA